MRKSCNNCERAFKCVIRSSNACDSCLAGDTPSNWKPGENYIADKNADHIRQMSDEELAEFLCASSWRQNEHNKCLEWLKKPVEEWNND